MRLPEDVESVLFVRGEKAAVALLCRRHAMSRGAAKAWVASCSVWGLPELTPPVSKIKIAAVMLSAFMAGLLLAALEQAL
ncbi:MULTISPECIES: hypothetical protein [unclassified Alcanivorax]|jgi:hypothetical protein|uniref:hypothetical protein n=1 Tax=unclassified Alcanivorax TaxID=2638842 RepID=UPI000789CF97|nr:MULTISPECIES: hypothetical protein [unclassified Alcanivorax]MEE2602081.1 hypothetical protein [Pseudomonadota bacterium]MBB11174.1 hypothetical protein [Alcanivorax sp.]MBU85120.1 hypothetical protein [Alcanivorax sp.]MBU86423.1 hypothetical protein [Alcanivorax sp.]SEF79145.1 hypothetical protein SAMN04515663_103344 [Alcanivorax sp. DSM 26293]|tara:strand:+ start:1517 stop:1756 length:240 start_codon:yes stop_codon:yes gene_type:complete